MNTEQFKKEIKKTRAAFIPKPKEIVEEAFQKSPYYTKDPSYFLGHATQILYDLRNECWNTYLKHEKIFNIEMGKKLILHDDEIKNSDNKSASEIIGIFLDKYGNHVFELFKSNTNSRRSRAGKEFEALMESILLRTEIFFDNQGIIGSKLFEASRLGKLVDCVVPGVIEYNLEKRKCSLVSMKTSLRERWQEVPEEMKRTGAQEMFLLTLDKEISKNTIEALAQHNVTLVVPDDLKTSLYRGNLSVYGLTQFLCELIDRNKYWFERNDLPKDYYEKKIETIEIRLQNINDAYERKIIEKFRNFFLEKLNKFS